MSLGLSRISYLGSYGDGNEWQLGFFPVLLTRVPWIYPSKLGIGKQSGSSGLFWLFALLLFFGTHALPNQIYPILLG
ncbi:MAG TPA: hypothetical protein DCY59_00870 [Micrococcaceae bacterium]|nr:hypothetical protein [Micrococcaceae bacterium]